MPNPTHPPNALDALLDEHARLSIEWYRACKLARDLETRRAAVRERIRQLSPSGWKVTIDHVEETTPAPPVRTE